MDGRVFQMACERLMEGFVQDPGDGFLKGPLTYFRGIFSTMAKLSSPIFFFCLETSPKRIAPGQTCGGVCSWDRWAHLARRRLIYASSSELALGRSDDTRHAAAATIAPPGPGPVIAGPAARRGPGDCRAPFAAGASAPWVAAWACRGRLACGRSPAARAACGLLRVFDGKAGNRREIVSSLEGCGRSLRWTRHRDCQDLRSSLSG